MTTRSNTPRQNTFICVVCNKVYSLNRWIDRNKKKKICSQCEQRKQNARKTKIKNSSSRTTKTKNEESINYDDSENFIESNDSIDDLGNNDDDYL